MKKNIFVRLSAVACLTLGLSSCENENENLTIFGVDNLTTKTVEIPLTAYTSVNDTVRSDERNLLVPIGISQSNIFGNEKSSFVSQVNYSGTYGSSLGLNSRYKNAKLIIPISISSSLDSDDYNDLVNASTATIVKSAVKDDQDTLVVDYPIDSIFNISASKMNLKAAKTANRLNIFSSSYFSNGISYSDGIISSAPTRGAVLGTLEIGQTVRDTIYAKYNSDTKKYVYAGKPSTIAYRMSLNDTELTDLFDKIKSGYISNGNVLKDYFPGIEIYTEDSTGFNVMVNPTGINISLGYIVDNDSDADGIPNATDTSCGCDSSDTNTLSKFLTFGIGTNTETRASLYERDFTTANNELTNQINNPSTNPATNLFILGNGGSQLIINVNENDPFTVVSENIYTSGLLSFINEVKKTNQLTATISDAYIDMYVNESLAPVDAKYPFYLTIYDYTNKREVADYTQFVGILSSIDDYKGLIGGTYDSENNRYRFKLTQHFLNILLGKTYTDIYDTDNDGNTSEELPYTNVTLAVSQGEHIANSFITTANSSIYRSSRRYLPGNVALFGNTNDSKKLKLVLKYSFINNN